MLSDTDHRQSGPSECIDSISEYLYGEVFNLAENGLILIDSERRIVLWNEWMEQNSSITREQAIKNKFTDIFPQLEGTRIENAIDTALERRTASLLSRTLNKTMFPLFYIGRAGEREKIEQSVIVKPVSSSDRDYCLVQIVDVSSMVHREKVLKVLAREAEEARKAAEDVSRLKSEFTSTVSHELRTPLTSIRGALGLISSGVMGELPVEVIKLIEIACNNTERLLFLINDILDIEKIESGKMKFVMGPVDLMAVLTQSIEANQPYGEQYKVRFTLAEFVVGPVVNADTDRLMQVLNNLLSNAAKFSPEGGVVEISTHQLDDTIRVQVRDDGPGIPLQFQSKIFEKFSQADGSDTRKVGGTGLGLSISKAIMEKMAGAIGFETEEGKGTTFYIDIPLYRE